MRQVRRLRWRLKIRKTKRRKCDCFYEVLPGNLPNWTGEKLQRKGRKAHLLPLGGAGSPDAHQPVHGPDIKSSLFTFLQISNKGSISLFISVPLKDQEKWKRISAAFRDNVKIFFNLRKFYFNLITTLSTCKSSLLTLMVWLASFFF